MLLNNITSLHTRADIDHKDVVWDFIVDNFRDSLHGCIEYKDDRFAVYSQHGKLVEVIHEGNALRIESGDHDAAIEIAHKIIDPVNETDSSDVYGKVFDPAVDPKLRALFVSFFHSNTSDLKCRYKVEYEGKTYEGEFFLDMLDDAHYEGTFDDNPDRHIFYHPFSTDGGECNHGIEIQVILNGDGKFEYSDSILESAEAYLWRRCEDEHLENYDTIDAEIEIINIETNEVLE